VKTFLANEGHGEYDTKGLLYITTPDKERIDVNRFWGENDEGKMVEISKEEYEERLARRIDSVRSKAASHLMFTLISNSAKESEIEWRETWYGTLTVEQKNEIYDKLEELCSFFDTHYDFNTFGMHQALCHEETCPEIEEHEELKAIQDYLINDVLGRYRKAKAEMDALTGTVEGTEAESK